MAKLGSYYGLCPLIDSKSLLGISQDSEKGVVLITLGKNIASRYKLSDQKQICSWRTKEKFSSAVVYDKKLSKYLAAFNHSHIKLWGAEDENLDKLKKYKFNKQIHSIFSGNGNTYIVFQNGSIYLLDDVLEMRKTLYPEQMISDSEQIDEILCRTLNDQFYMGLITKSSNETNFYWAKISSENWRFSVVRLQRDDCTLKGCVLHCAENVALFLTVYIPGVVGAIDGCHISIKQPTNNAIDFYNRKEYHSIILQAVCDDRKILTDVFIGMPGRVHDARVFRNSPLYDKLIGNPPLLPAGQHIIGDAAYPLLANLLKPYRDNGHLTARQSRFNEIFSSQRSVIERTFALLLGSDGRIFSYQLENSSEKTMPGQLFAVTEYISTNNNVCMLSLDENYMAIYGANCNEEGAMLIIYNTQFKVTQSKQPFKLFTNDAKLWCYENNLLLPVGQNLAVIQFYLETEQLAALVGSHKNVQSEADVDIAIVQEFEIASWDKKFNFRDVQIPEVLSDEIKDFIKQGLPESIIIGQILPDIFKKQDIELLSSCINYFIDIPEKYLAKILKYLIVTDSKYFTNKIQHTAILFPHNLQPVARTELIDKIFCKSFNDILLLPYLRSEFTVTDVLSLINYICYLLSENGHELPSMNTIKSEARLIDWSCILIDSSFQKLLLGKDETIKNVLIQFSRLIEEHVNAYEDLRSVSSLLNHFKIGKVLGQHKNIPNLKYSVEQISLY